MRSNRTVLFLCLKYLLIRLFFNLRVVPLSACSQAMVLHHNALNTQNTNLADVANPPMLKRMHQAIAGILAFGKIQTRSILPKNIKYIAFNKMQDIGLT